MTRSVVHRVLASLGGALDAPWHVSSIGGSKHSFVDPFDDASFPEIAVLAIKAARAVSKVLGSPNAVVRAFALGSDGEAFALQHNEPTSPDLLARCRDLLLSGASDPLVSDGAPPNIEVLLPLGQGTNAALQVIAPEGLLQGRIGRLRAVAQGALEGDASTGRGPRMASAVDRWSPDKESAAQPVRVLIVDRQRLSGELLAAGIGDRAMQIIGVVTSAKDAVQRAQATTVDLVIIDLEHPDGAIWLGKKLLQLQPSITLIALSGGGDHRLANEAVKAGFHGCVTRDISLAHLLRSIFSALSGDVVISDRLATPRSPDARRAQAMADALTRREREILELLVAGVNSKDIARRLSISTNTLRTHVSSILAKLQVHSRLEAVTFATQHRILTPMIGL